MERNLKSNQSSPSVLSLIPIDTKDKEFQKLMSIYEKALMSTKVEIENIKESLEKFYNYNVINNIDCRIKSPESIICKMKKKKYDLNYKALIEKVNDIAGIRIVCPFKSDLYKIQKIIQESSFIEVIEVKDYVFAPKKSGYSGIHIIGQIPVDVGEAVANVKIEIQIRTMAMDFWATVEHKMKYKAQNKLSKIDSKKMILYAKIINQLDEKISKINASCQ